MAKVITVSTKFLSGHPRAGQPTFFVQKIWNSLLDLGFDKEQYLSTLSNADRDYLRNFENLSPAEDFQKHHTVRSGHRWKTGDLASLRIWSGLPYQSRQIAIAHDIPIRAKNIEINKFGIITSDFTISAGDLAKNDGLSEKDFSDWFKPRLPVSGQILIWNETYLTY